MSLKEYQTVSKLGSGSFGVVYKVRRKDNGEECVLKEVEMRAMDRKMKEWAMNQVKIMKNIKSQFIVQYLQSFIQKEKLYICMEYCSGGDLAQYMKAQMGKPLPEQTVWRLSLQIMVGLRQLHRNRILHRDIKTMNIFLTKNKDVRIGDLGVARTLTGDFANTIVGTPYYLSPEMCQEKPYNEKTDVWAMGCLIYELCTGRHPFEGNSQAALALKIVVGKYSAIPSHYSQVTSWVIKSCLSVDYKRRPTIPYILAQPDVIKMANKLNISLEVDHKREAEVKPKTQVVVVRPVQRAVKVQSKPVVKIGQMRVLPKRGAQKEERRVSVERNKSRSIERNNKSIDNKNGNRSIEKQNNKPNQGQVNKRQVKPPPMIPKVIPKKTSSGGFQVRKADPKGKQPSPTQLKSSDKSMEDKKPKESQRQVEILKRKVVEEDKEDKKIPRQEEKKLVMFSKSRKSFQEVVGDDELFKDFGITPQKLTVMQQKMELKKINTINWNIEESEEASQDRHGQKTIFKELPTIRTHSNCGLVAIECKQVEDDDDMVAEQIDDNAPYKSSEDIPGEEDEDEHLLIDPQQQIEEDSDLKRREKLLLLEKKIFQNQKRRKELLSLKEQGEKELLVKMDKSKLDKIISILYEGSDQEIDRVIQKELNSVGASKFYKIFYWQMEIIRCEQNIAKCAESSQQFQEK